MSRVIKAARVQLESSPPAHDHIGGVSPSALEAAKAELEKLGRQAQERLERANTEAAAILAEAESRAKRILADADGEARERLRAAEATAAADAEQAREAAFREGHQSGLAEGLEEGRRQAEAAIKAATKVMAEAQEKAAQRLLQSETELVELATAIARRIIIQELTINPEAAVAMVRDALMKLRDTPSVVLRVAIDTLPLYRERLERMKADFREIVALEFMGDPLLSSGDFMIDTPFGTVDGRLDAQLDVLRQALLDLGQERIKPHE